MAKPLLKWAGGKRKLIPQIQSIIESNSHLLNNSSLRFFDAFAGGGSVGIYFSNYYRKVILNDTNDELINLYRIVKDEPDLFICLMQKHEKNNSKEYYNEIRKLDRSSEYNNLSDCYKASRTLYMNRVCFNGLYRLNREGYFNVPFGKYKNPLICDFENIILLSNALKRNFELRNDDFQTLVEDVRKGDIVYFDPPYDQEVPQSFVSYTSEGFSRKDQIRLKHCVDILTERGAFVILSNSATDFILSLYNEYINEDSVIFVGRSISAKVSSRTPAKEILINNFWRVDNENLCK